MGRLLWLAIVALGCREPERTPAARDPVVPPPAPVAGTAPYGGWAVSCAVQEANALRVDCTVDGNPPSALEIRFAPADGSLPERAVTGSGPVVTLYGMVEETPYTWIATPVGRPEEAVGGTLTTGELSPFLDIAAPAVGPTTATESLLYLYGCGGGTYAVITRPDGRLWWYQALDSGLEGFGHNAIALTLTPDDTLLVNLDRGIVREWDLAGNLLFEVTANGGDLPRPLHHDLFRRGGYTYMLNAHEETYADDPLAYVTDGIYVLDATGVEIASWDLDSFITPSGDNPLAAGYWRQPFPFGVDWSHANGLYVEEGTLDLYVSFYMLDTVLKMAGDPLSPDFGTVAWVLPGSPVSPWWGTGDMVVTSEITEDLTFEGQHNPSILPDGRLLLFDNERSPGDSRTLVLDLDPDGGTAEIEEAWDLGRLCPIQGSAFPLENGNVIATCASGTIFYELAPGVPDPVRTVTPRCSAGLFFGYVPRAIPISL